MKRTLPLLVPLLLLAFPALAGAETPAPGPLSAQPDPSADFPEFYADASINTVWVVLAAMVVFLMQAGFAFLEIGFSRAKNAGTVVAKILTNLSIATLGYWACGFAFAFGVGEIAGTDGFFLSNYGDPIAAFPVMGFSNVTPEVKFFFQFAFCAVSLAIVWGTTLERIKFATYVLFAIVFSTVIYPIGSHWVFGGGWLQANLGMQDFAGSTAVHLIGATAGLAALLHLGARRGKYGADGKPRAIPGHNMPLFGLGIFFLWFGWFGFNAGSTLGAGDGRFGQIIVVTNLAAAAGVLGALAIAKLKTKSLDIGMAGNGAIGALVAITAPSGYVSAWAAPIIGLIAGIIVPLCIYAIDKKIDDPVGALSAHGVAGIWGTLSCGLFTDPALAEYNAFGDGGLFYTGDFGQLGVQALGVVVVFAFVFIVSYGSFAVIKLLLGGSLRVEPDEEDAGLDISEHGMYGYPEQFIPAPELIGYSSPDPSFAAELGRTGRGVTATPTTAGSSS